jgi:hypothetical protein
VGTTRRNFTFYSIVAALLFLERSSSCLFLADCPDPTFVMRDGRGNRLSAPCKKEFSLFLKGRFRNLCLYVIAIGWTPRASWLACPSVECGIFHKVDCLGQL